MSLSPNSLLAHYTIISKIGAGGMGEVYLAEDQQLRRRVAIKLLSPGLVSDKHANNRLLKEARAAATLDHPNICSIYEVGQADGRAFIAFQYIEGETLEARIKRNPPEWKGSVAIAVQIAEALEEAHSQGIIHRDIKPSNIMITTRGQAKVLDFGLARVITGVVSGEAETQSMMTAPGTIMGTMPYMSPEQVRAEVLDGRSDIFSFGVVLYEMLSGRQPFANRSGAEVISAILKDEPPTLLGSAPEELQRIVRKCLEKDRNLRYQHAAEVRVDLQRLGRDSEPASLNISAKPEAKDKIDRTTPSRTRIRFTLRSLIVPAAIIVVAFIAAALFYFPRAKTAGPLAIKSLAVLPLKSLDAGENYLGLGIADAVIRRISQTGELTVRPTSAVRRYLTEDADVLTAARQLNADAVLDGSVQRAGDVLRVSVNLLRTADGSSLWADHFDMRMTDIFTIQDTVAQQVATRLRLQLDPSQQARLTKRYTSNPIAYDFYMKGFIGFDQRISLTKAQWEPTIDFFKRAIEADPNFALAHAQLAYTYATIAVFIEPTEPAWAERAKEEINLAQTLDPQLAEIHLARAQLLFSSFEGYQGEAAVREVSLAQQLNPDTGHAELAFLYLHLGLVDLGSSELQRAAEIDPTSEFVKGLTVLKYVVGSKYDEYAAHRERYHVDEAEAWYLMGTSRLDEAQKSIEEWTAKKPDEIRLPNNKALLLALKGDFRAAEAAIAGILSRHPAKDPLYHHAAYDIACIYALEGKSAEAVKWLRETSATGFPCYPLFERDAYLNKIRLAPEFIQFMTEMKAQNELYKREFGEGATQ
ncbi:MAG TPA: protein kinase [Pyrinomonadaceae bacterium]|jgi:Serine/threonine protein kinase|nr:protein kinase [Pyrinomonadaceae bacterium]